MYGETWQLQRFTGEGRGPRGNVIKTYAEPVAVPDCGYDPGSVTETAPAGQTVQVVSKPRLFCPAGVTAGPQDRMSGPAGTFEVEGHAEPWRSPLTGWRPGVVVNLKRVT